VSACVLAIDLGTSRVKVGFVDENLETLAAASHPYPTHSTQTAMAEQYTADWLGAIRQAWAEVRRARPDLTPDAVVLTAQMPTLVELDAQGSVIEPAVTWQDARADDLVAARVDASQADYLYRTAGTPIDGRYLIPMWLRRRRDGVRAPATVLSAKDYLFYVLTGELVTDPSTASGFGNYDLRNRTFHQELTHFWGIDPGVLPRVEPSDYTAPLIASGAALPGVAGLPVVLGSADSVAAFHLVERVVGPAVAVIDGSSTVILAQYHEGDRVIGSPLLTPLVDAHRWGIEMDLLATGSSINWLSQLLGVDALELEEAALTLEAKAGTAVMMFPYLAGGEQGALWRTDLSGVISNLHLGTSRGDLALALYEGIAFEILRCLETLGAGSSRRVVNLQGNGVRGIVPALVGALHEGDVLAVTGVSASLLGVALVALEALGARVNSSVVAQTWAHDTPILEEEYQRALRTKQAHYRATAL